MPNGIEFDRLDHAKGLSQFDPRIEAAVGENNTKETELEEKLKLFIQEIGIRSRTSNLLNEKGIHTVEQLLMCSRRTLLGIPNFGEVSLEEVYDALESIGFHQKMRQKITPQNTRP